MNIITLTPDSNGLVPWPTLSAEKKAVVTVGVFDGMHRGHRAVVERVVALAREHRCFSVVIVFDPRPCVVHGYAATHHGGDLPDSWADTGALSSVGERIRVMRDLGVDDVIVVHYTLAFAAKSYRFFLGQLVGKLGMRDLVLGSDAAMGANRSGDVEAIRMLADGTGMFTLSVVDDLGPGYVRIPTDATQEVPSGPGEPEDPLAGMTKGEARAWSKAHHTKKVRAWSSSNVRYLLAHGRVGDANEILGDLHAVEGEVVHGEQRGRTIGFPTANLAPEVDGYIPVDGVYAGWLIDLGENDDDPLAERDRIRLAAHSPWRWPSAISIGTKPTFSKLTGIHDRVIEAYAITDAHPDLYGHRVRVEFHRFLRPQITFDSVDELKAELAHNARQVSDILR